MKPEDILISSSDFDAFVASQVEFLKSRLDDKPESLIPYLFIKTLDMEGKDSLTVVAIAADFNEDSEKRSLLMGLGRKTYEQKQIPLAIALSCEAWLAQNPPKGTEPRHCENKREVALLAAQSLGNKLCKMVSIPVKRDGQNRMKATMAVEWPSETKGIRTPILDHFFRGFYSAAMANPPNA